LAVTHFFNHKQKKSDGVSEQRKVSVEKQEHVTCLIGFVQRASHATCTAIFYPFSTTHRLPFPMRVVAN